MINANEFIDMAGDVVYAFLNTIMKNDGLFIIKRQWGGSAEPPQIRRKNARRVVFSHSIY